jgi:lysophospholipase L1-like esterase
MSAAGAPLPKHFSLGRSLLFSSLIVLAFFGLAEAILRLVGLRAPSENPRILLREMDTDITLPFMRADRDLFWSLRPGFRGEFRGRPVTINSLGLRGGELELPKPAGRRRIVCFGDSITFGFGVGDDESYSHFLGAALADRNVDVVNAGVTGYTSHQVRGLLRRLAPVVQADVATVCIGWNDQNRRPVTDRVYERRLHAAMAVEGRLDHVYLYRALKALYLRAPLAGRTRAAEAQRVPLGDYRENLGAFVRECRTHGIQPVFLALPHRRRKGEALVDGRYNEAMAELGRSLGVAVVDVGDLGLATTMETNEAYFIDPLHLSPSGSESMARMIARQLLALGIV